MPALVDVRSRVLTAYGTAVNWYTFDAQLTRTDGLPGATEKGRIRYQRFVTELLKAGYAIEWQTPPGLHYGDRASFERALNPALTPALAYAD